MADRELLLCFLNKLSKNQYHSLLFHLTDQSRNPHLSRLETDDISPTELVQKLEETYTNEALRIIADIMKRINRMDLYEELRVKLGDSCTELCGRDKLVTDQQLMRLARCLGKSWKQIGIEVLGIENIKLEQIEEDNQNNLVMKAFYMLKAWKNKEKTKATPDHLCQLLSSDGVPLELEAYDFLND
ncbi:FAS-associated death domain protein-like isoform X2 [Pleurodeles waltl]|uniref:FAS-associated death domain protein-like isoform X2 n=1 Tax=Pleurodeles waltl TaxID=8319 RepID=UPI0037093C45